MKDFFRLRKRTVLLACVAVAAGWFAWAEVSAQFASADESVTIDSNELRRELSDEQKRHNAALSALQKARAALAAANVDTAAVDRLIESENADHARRDRRLKAWLDSDSAQTDDDASRTRSIVDRELRDFGKAIGSINQSIRITPITSRTAQTGGARFVDYVDDPDYQNKDGQNEDGDQTSEGSDTDQKEVPRENGARNSNRESQAGANVPLGEALFREVPQDGNSDQPDNPGAIDQVQEQIQILSRQLAGLQKQLDALKAGQQKP